MQLNDKGKVYVNQGFRPARCIAVKGDRALVEYVMPNAGPVLYSCSTDSDFEEWSWTSARNVSQNKPPAFWREEVKRYNAGLPAQENPTC